MVMYRPGEKLGYLPAYTRTPLTDALHEEFGFRTDYEILTDVSIKKSFEKPIVLAIYFVDLKKGCIP